MQRFTHPRAICLGCLSCHAMFLFSWEHLWDVSLFTDLAASCTACWMYIVPSVYPLILDSDLDQSSASPLSSPFLPLAGTDTPHNPSVTTPSLPWRWNKVKVVCGGWDSQKWRYAGLKAMGMMEGRLKDYQGGLCNWRRKGSSEGKCWNNAGKSGVERRVQ